jgi:protein TonB
MDFNDSMTPPKMVSGPNPQYTERALEQEVEGLMVVKCVVTVDGLVHECRVIRSLPYMDRAVVDALEKRHYTPALLQGKPVEVAYTFSLRLTLPN